MVKLVRTLLVWVLERLVKISSHICHWDIRHGDIEESYGLIVNGSLIEYARRFKGIHHVLRNQIMLWHLHRIMMLSSVKEWMRLFIHLNKLILLNKLLILVLILAFSYFNMREFESELIITYVVVIALVLIKNLCLLFVRRNILFALFEAL
jgi:hypothetical protein